MTSCQEVEKFNASIFYNNQTAQFGPFFVLKLKRKIFLPKKSLESISSFYIAVTSCKKSENPML